MDMDKKAAAGMFLQLADLLEGGSAAKKPRIILTAMGSEHGERNSLEGALMAAKAGVDVCCIGSLEAEGITSVKAENEEQSHRLMEEMLQSGQADGAVTMHYPFPIGVSTVGRAITPSRGREMFVACTTGASSPNRIEALVKNAIYGIICAKACGVKRPTVGILNIEGARQAESALRELNKGGYDIAFAESARSDGGALMRGNDVLQGSADVLVTDSLTGNVIMKMLSAFSTGGSYEASGFGYGPGIGRGYEKLVLILSRASGAAVAAKALEYAADLVKGRLFDVAREEFQRAERAGLNGILKKLSSDKREKTDEQVPMPSAHPVTAGISGIEITAIEDGVKALWKQGIYAESGMGCTGPLIMVSEANREKAEEVLKKAGFAE